MSDPRAVTATSREDGGLLDVVVDVPKGNVLTGAVMRALHAALEAAASRPELRCVVLRGAGRNFSFGASVEEHRRGTVVGMLRTFHALVRYVAAYPVPVVAAVDGRCLGGAFELVLACHAVVATRAAVFACPEIKLGVFPPVLAAIGPARLGGALAERLLLTGSELDAEDARGAGLVAALAPGDVTLEAFVVDWYQRTFAPLSGFALRQAVKASRTGSALEAALDEALSAVERQYLESVAPSHDGNEGIEAFLARREPAWRHA